MPDGYAERDSCMVILQAQTHVLYANTCSTTISHRSVGPILFIAGNAVGVFRVLSMVSQQSPRRQIHHSDFHRNCRQSSPLVSARTMKTNESMISTTVFTLATINVYKQQIEECSAYAWSDSIAVKIFAFVKCRTKMPIAISLINI